MIEVGVEYKYQEVRMKKRMKKLGCLLLAFTMSYQTVALASELPPQQAQGKNEAAESVNEVTEASGEPELAKDQQVKNTGDASQEADVLPPQMGWSSWNFFKQNINEDDCCRKSPCGFRSE